MISEWMKVMLEEISRKKVEAEQGRIEEQTRVEEQVRVEQQGRRDDDSTQG
jgi:hypothetical protein